MKLSATKAVAGAAPEFLAAAKPALRAVPGASAEPAAAAAVRAVLALPDQELDYARAKVALDRIVDPAIDADATLAELDRLADNAWRLAGHSPTESAKLAAVRTVIYESGPWNDHRPFAYDHSDPLGHHIPNKLLHNYLATRRGQCVSMPILFLILADRLELDVALAEAPEHIFVRYTDRAGRVFNLEATSGAHPARTEWFRKCLPMSDRAVESGLYMRTLSRREGVALMATTAAEYLSSEGRHEELIAVCVLILEHHPRAGVVMVVQGSAYGALLQREFEQKYPIMYLIPAHLRARYLLLRERNNSLIEAAEALGWEPGEYYKHPIVLERRNPCS
jgi:regulator of sirC expression with transglutaminase-like and TPR domain